MKHRLASLFSLLFACGLALGAGQTQERRPPEGKTFTDRSIDVSVIVEGSPEAIFEAWTTTAGANQFFGVDSVIELRDNGPYEIYFLPRDHPESVANSSQGARLLELDKPSRLSFEWTAPPFAAALNTKPLVQWIEVNIDPVEEAPGHCRVRVQHHGFGSGPLWDRTYEFFQRGWSRILYRLDRLFAQRSRIAARNR